MAKLLKQTELYNIHQNIFSEVENADDDNFPEVAANNENKNKVNKFSCSMKRYFNSLSFHVFNVICTTTPGAG